MTTVILRLVAYRSFCDLQKRQRESERGRDIPFVLIRFYCKQYRFQCATIVILIFKLNKLTVYRMRIKIIRVLLNRKFVLRIQIIGRTLRT